MGKYPPKPPPLTARSSKALTARVKRIAEMQNMSVSAMIKLAIEQYIARVAPDETRVDPHLTESHPIPRKADRPYGDLPRPNQSGKPRGFRG